MIAQKPPRQPIETAVPLDFGAETPPLENDEISGLAKLMAIEIGSIGRQELQFQNPQGALHILAD